MTAEAVVDEKANRYLNAMLSSGIPSIEQLGLSKSLKRSELAYESWAFLSLSSLLPTHSTEVLVPSSLSALGVVAIETAKTVVATAGLPVAVASASAPGASSVEP